jgi:hypothetical protein
MTVEYDLLSALAEKIKDSSSNKNRDIDIVHYFYGFKDNKWPTLDDTATHFDMNNRERIRQIINSKFKNLIKPADIPAITRFSELLRQQFFWPESDLVNLLEENHLSDIKTNIKGLLRLTIDIGIYHGYELYTPDLKPVTRQTQALFDENFIIHKDNFKTLQSLYKKAQKIPGRCGLANLNTLEDERLTNQELRIIKLLIKFSEHAWTHEREDGFWYIFENRDNTLINYSEKVFSTISYCSAEELSITYRNALDSRTHNLPYPDQSIIQQYLESSIFFDNNNGLLKFIGETRNPNDIENEIINYLLLNGTVTFKELRDYLITKGYGKAHADKNVTYSPFVYVDRKGGRTKHTYRLAGTTVQTPTPAIEDNNYQIYRERLRKIQQLGTDDTAEQKRRREQPILTEWLFSDKTHEKCAICGNNFSVKALVTAHKKKRSECNEAERLDPYIVMPVCVFGCDFLYEHSYIYIDKGTVRKGLQIENETYEARAIHKLEGRKLPDSWLLGPESYFRPQ